MDLSIPDHAPLAHAMTHNADALRRMPPSEALSIVDAVAHAFASWHTRPLVQRTALVESLAALLHQHGPSLARCITRSMGKAVRESALEIEKCQLLCHHYASTASTILAPRQLHLGSEAYATISHQALGVVCGIMPWNFPFWQVCRVAIPALLAGNGFVLKHAHAVLECAAAFEWLCREAGFPADLCRAIYVAPDAIEPIIAHEAIAAISLTGSCAAGAAVGALAGKHLKKTLLELGGSDPYIILLDANLSEAARICAKSRLINAGQSCVAAKRLIVVEEVYEAFIKALHRALQAFRLGDPMSPDTDIGPMVSLAARQALHAQVQASVQAGARCQMGGRIPEGAEAFYPVTLLVDVVPGMPAYHEELFGPVAVVIRAKNAEDAVRIANDSAFGLGAAIFSENLAQAEAMAMRIQAGMCSINEMVISDPRLPFGGMKQSGHGRELGDEGLLALTQPHTLRIHTPS